MFRVTPIGSCRVAGPLQSAQSNFGYVVDKSRSYGYCHSSGEAVQLARFLLGQFAPPKDLWPLVARSVSFAKLSAQSHDPANLYVVELSSAKRITIDGVFIQLNYLTSAYRFFFESGDRARAFWDLARAGDQKRIDAFLKVQCRSETDRAVLRRIRMEMTTPEQLRQDIKTLQSMLPRIIIVTHVNARKPDGRPIHSRASFIEMVKSAARASGVRVYDPTKRMIEFGQKNAIADYSEGLAHYSDDFAHAVAADWHKIAICPAIDDAIVQGDEGTVSKMLQPHVTALLQAGDFADLSDRLEKLSASRSNLDGLTQIKVQLGQAKNDAMAHFDDLMHQTKQWPADLVAQRKLAELAFDLDRFDTMNAALKTLAQADDLPPLRELIQMGRSARRRGYPMAAVETLQLTLKMHPTSTTAADALAQLFLNEATELVSDLPNDIADILRDVLEPLQLLRLCDVAEWDHEIDLSKASSSDITEIAAHLTMQSDIPRAAKMITAWRIQSPVSQILPIAIAELLNRWFEIAEARADQMNRTQLFNAILSVDPHQRDARNGLRDVRRDLREQVREAVALNDHQALDNIAALNAMLPTPLRELDLYRARQRFEAEQFDAAIKIGLLAAKALPDNISVWVLLMRAAVRKGDLFAVDTYAQRVIELCDHDTERLEAEAIKHRHANALACGRQALQEADQMIASQLEAIANAATPSFRHRKAGAV